jgi:hypothetical protein
MSCQRRDEGQGVSAAPGTERPCHEAVCHVGVNVSRCSPFRMGDVLSARQSFQMISQLITSSRTFAKG